MTPGALRVPLIRAGAGARHPAPRTTDPSGIATYSAGGRAVRLGLLWSAAVTGPPLNDPASQGGEREDAAGGTGTVPRANHSAGALPEAAALPSSSRCWLVANTINISPPTSAPWRRLALVAGGRSEIYAILFAAGVPHAADLHPVPALRAHLKWLTLGVFSYVGTVGWSCTVSLRESLLGRCCPRSASTAATSRSSSACSAHHQPLPSSSGRHLRRSRSSGRDRRATSRCSSRRPGALEPRAASRPHRPPQDSPLSPRIMLTSAGHARASPTSARARLDARRPEAMRAGIRPGGVSCRRVVSVLDARRGSSAPGHGGDEQRLRGPASRAAPRLLRCLPQEEVRG